jgi:hypothetical protein
LTQIKPVDRFSPENQVFRNEAEPMQVIPQASYAIIGKATARRR